MIDINIIKNLSLKFRFKRPKPETEYQYGNEERDSLWNYLTSDLKIKTSRDREYAVRMFGLGWDQLTANCFNLEGEISKAESDYGEARNKISEQEAEEVERLAESVVWIRKWGKTDFAKIDEDKLAELGYEIKPQMHLALSQRAIMLRAQRQLAIQTPSQSHADYTDLRERLKERPGIAELEQELPYFWMKMRHVLR